MVRNALPGDEAFQSWIELAEGAEEAQRAAFLPREVREQLYQNILLYGPAGDQILSFLAACRLRGSIPALNILAVQLDDVSDEVMDWRIEDTELLNLDYRYLALMSNVFDRGDPTGGGLSVWWLFTGQFLFPKRLAETCKPFAEQLNVTLENLGEPLLGGNFAPAKHPNS